VDHPPWVTPVPPPSAEHPDMVEYEISVKGRVGSELLADLGGWESREQPALTILRGDVDGVGGLRALFDRLSDRGLELVEVRQVRRGG
jgi:hypothetical protein